MTRVIFCPSRFHFVCKCELFTASLIRLLRRTWCGSAAPWCSRVEVTWWLMSPVLSPAIRYSARTPDLRVFSHHTNELDTNIRFGLLFGFCLGNALSLDASLPSASYHKWQETADKECLGRERRRASSALTMRQARLVKQVLRYNLYILCC